MPPGNPHLPALRKRVEIAPHQPGVYRWLGDDGTVLYVGKAKDLRVRLRSYVAPEPDKAIGPWKLSLIDRIVGLEWTVVRTELEALILEINQIKDIRPKYNVLMKDGKNYVYVRVSVQEAYPRVEVVRQLKEDGSKYFGPFLTAYETRRTLDMLRELYPYHACKTSLDSLNRSSDKPANQQTSKRLSPCLDAQIGTCNGLCTGRVTQEEHRHAIEGVLAFFRGDRKPMRDKAEELMRAAAADRKFEKAAHLRDTITFIDSLIERQTVSGVTGEDADIFGVALARTRAHAAYLQERAGKVIVERSIPLSGNPATLDEALSQFLPQFYADATDIPALILVPAEFEERVVLEQWLTEKRGRKVEIRIPERGRKSHLLDLAEKNAQDKLRQSAAKWETASENVEQALLELKETLLLPHDPLRIEGYDISHLGGTETVGSMVVMRKGKAANDHYRSFTIKTLREGDVDDYASLREVLLRRLRHLSISLSAELDRFATLDITIGKARKADAVTLEKIIAEHPLMTQGDINYKECLVARRQEEIVGCVRLHRHPSGTLELKSLWVHKEAQGEKLGQLLIRKILAGVKRGKVYVTGHPDLEEYYVSAGFQPIHNPPPVIQERLDREAQDHPELRPAFVGHYETGKNKADPSLTTRADLLVIDGGKGQLNAAVDALNQLGLAIPVIGLAKREEEVFVPGVSDPIPFPKDSQAKFLLMRLRDEAHRFANRHREGRGRKHAIVSVLDDVHGIGPETRKALLKKFGSIEAIRTASDGELLGLLTTAQLLALRAKLPAHAEPADPAAETA